MNSGFAAELQLMRASALLEADPAAAAREASALLRRIPEYEEAKLLLATACRRLGEPAAATGVLESLAQAQVDSPILKLELGKAYAAQARHADAIRALEAAVALDARLAEAWRELAAQRFKTGDTRGGDQAYTLYRRLAPVPAQLADAAAAIGEQRLDVAAQLLQRRLLEAPDDVEAVRMLANTERDRDNFIEAVELLKRCLELAPGHAEARYELAAELCAQHRHEEAAPHVKRLLEAEPSNGMYIRLQALSLRFYGRNEEAIALMQQVVSENPQHADYHLFHGHLLRDVGEQAKAIEAYRQALAIQPALGEAYSSLANLKTVRFQDADVRAMQQQLANCCPSEPNRVHFEFALGKALEDAGKYEQAFEHYALGNAIHRSTTYYSGDMMHAGVERTRKLYTREFFAERRGWGSRRVDPIFIVGMPRAGSTLLEQILASHSQVEGTRELPDVPAIARELILKAGPSTEPSYPVVVGKLGRAEIDALAEQYLSETAVHRTSGKPRFVDKLPGNFAHIGLIHLMFPRAAIIDARRHPLGCCFSCFRQQFGRGQSFSYNLGELGRFYRDYCELVQHMESVLPGRVHRVHYEQVVADPESTVRQLLDHCGLDFEPGCLKFYENRRVVNTISSEQVRRPISSDAVDQWRHFDPWLGPLKDSLGDIVERYPVFLPK